MSGFRIFSIDTGAALSVVLVDGAQPEGPPREGTTSPASAELVDYPCHSMASPGGLSARVAARLTA